MTSAEFQEKNRDFAHTNDRTIVIKELDGAGVRDCSSISPITSSA